MVLTEESDKPEEEEHSTKSRRKSRAQPRRRSTWIGNPFNKYAPDDAVPPALERSVSAPSVPPPPESPGTLTVDGVELSIPDKQQLGVSKRALVECRAQLETALLENETLIARDAECRIQLKAVLEENADVVEKEAEWRARLQEVVDEELDTQEKLQRAVDKELDTQEKLERAAEKIRALVANEAESIKKLENALADQEAASALNRALAEQEAAAREKLENVVQENDVLIEKATTLSSECMQNSEKLEVKDIELARKEAEVKDLKEELEQLKEQLNARTGEVDEFKEQLAVRNAEAEEFKEQLHVRNAEVKELEELKNQLEAQNSVEEKRANVPSLKGSTTSPTSEESPRDNCPSPTPRTPNPNLNSKLLQTSCEKIYDHVKRDDGTVYGNAFVNTLASRGILADDPRVSAMVERVHQFDGPITKQDFIGCIADSIAVLEKVYKGELAIPEFEDFGRELEHIHADIKREGDDGTVADYIPALARQNPNHFGVAVCSIDGQRKKIGEANVDFCTQACSTPITYCLALEQLGADIVHNHVGREPFNEDPDALKLSGEGKPHNPFINSGAIMTCALAGPEGMGVVDRFDYVTKQWARMAGGRQVGYSNSVYLSEKEDSNISRALTYLMNEHLLFPEGTDVLENLDSYLQYSALTADADSLSIVAATLANGGVCPVSGERVLRAETVKNCLSLMHSFGMCDYSSEFAFKVGLPAKSGMGGGLLVVVPNVMGFCTFSPPLDQHGNSVRGVDFFLKLATKFNFHVFDTLVAPANKRDPRRRREETESTSAETVIKCCSLGDLGALKRMAIKGISFSSMMSENDHRTPLHLAASNGHLNVVKYLVETDSEHVNPIDRWGSTPFDDARNEGWEEVAEFLSRHGGHRGPQRRRSLVADDAGEDSIALD